MNRDKPCYELWADLADGQGLRKAAMGGGPCESKAKEVVKGFARQLWVEHTRYSRKARFEIRRGGITLQFSDNNHGPRLRWRDAKLKVA